MKKLLPRSFSRLIGYARARTADGRGLDAQRAMLTQCASELGVQLVHVVLEDAAARALPPLERSGVQMLLKFVADGKADGVVVAAVEVLDERVRAAQRVVTAFKRAGIPLVVVTDPERVEDGKVAPVGLRKRVWQGRAIPYGYRVGVGLDGRKVWLVVKEQAAIVRRIHAESQEGASLVAIATGLNAAGVPSPRGKSWSPTAVRRILLCPFYAGRWEPTSENAMRRPPPIVTPPASDSLHSDDWTTTLRRLAAQ